MTDSNEPSWKTNPRCNKQQLAILRRCSKAKDITEWNEWREANPDIEILLQGADLRHAHLAGAFLTEAHLEGARLWQAHLEGALLLYAHLAGASLTAAHLEEAELVRAHLERADLTEAHLEGADLYGAYLEGADLSSAYLEGAELWHAHLEGAYLWKAHLEGAVLCQAHLEGADLLEANLGNAKLMEADLRGATLGRVDMRATDFSYAITDGATYIFPETEGAVYAVDRDTYASGVALANIRISPGVRQLLEYNVRRKRWLRWCGGKGGGRHPLKKARLSHWARKWPVWLFWQMSDYGRSTGRIALWFMTLSLVFAAVYFLCGLASPPGIVEGLFDYERGGQIVRINDPALVFLRAVYFSVVTMTTLGFGDINAQPLSYAGHLLLMLQVILGYVLLGALICRLAILFQAGGPAAKFTKTPKPELEEAGDADE